MRTSSRRLLLIWGSAAIVAACLLGVWILARGDGPFVIDAAWNTFLATVANPVLTGFSRVMNIAGGGWLGALVLPLAMAAALFVLRRPRAGAYFLAASALSAGFVQILKHLFGRARPEDILVISDYGSFPSGHTANAATIAVVAVVLFPRLWVLLVGVAWVLLMALSRTALHAHWLSDTLGGTLAGVGAALLLAAAFAVPLARERGRRAEPSLG